MGIQVKKKYTSLDAENPMMFYSAAPNYEITGLIAGVDYVISVAIDTVTFGQSEWSDSIRVVTTEVNGDISSLDALKDQIDQSQEALDEKLGNIQSGLKGIGEDIESIKSDISEMKEKDIELDGLIDALDSSCVKKSEEEEET